MCRLDAAGAPASLCNRSQARHDTAVSAVAGQAQVQGIVLTRTVRDDPGQRALPRVDCQRRRNEAKEPRFGYQRIADQLALAFDIPVGKHLVRRILANHYRPRPGSGGPSWLTFLGHSKGSLWSVDLFRCEPLILKTHWLMVVMDQCTRRIAGDAVCGGSPDGPTVCRMLRHIILSSAPPIQSSSDQDPLFECQRWKANLRILGVKEVKTIPHVPLFHPWLSHRVGSPSTRVAHPANTVRNMRSVSVHSRSGFGGSIITFTNGVPPSAASQPTPLTGHGRTCIVSRTRLNPS